MSVDRCRIARRGSGRVPPLAQGVWTTGAGRGKWRADTDTRAWAWSFRRDRISPQLRVSLRLSQEGQRGTIPWGPSGSSSTRLRVVESIGYRRFRSTLLLPRYILLLKELGAVGSGQEESPGGGGH